MATTATPVIGETPLVVEPLVGEPLIVAPVEPAEKKIVVRGGGGGSDAVYGIGMIGAWVYYIGRAKTWQEGVAGFCKGLVWPAFLVHAAFKALEKKE